MKKIVLFAFAIFAVGCSNDNNDDSVNKKMEADSELRVNKVETMETDFEILTSQSRDKSSDNRFQVGWSDWEKEETKFTWNSKSKELTITYYQGATTRTYKNCVVDGLKITYTYDIEAWEQNPEVVVFDFSDENTIRMHVDYDSLEHTNGNWTVSRESKDFEYIIKK